MEITKQDIQKSSLAQCINYLKLLGIEYQGQNAKKLKEILSDKLIDGKLTIPGGEEKKAAEPKNGAKVPAVKKGPIVIKKTDKKPVESKPTTKKVLKTRKKKGETKTANAIALFKKGKTAKEISIALDMHPSFVHTVISKQKNKK